MHSLPLTWPNTRAFVFVLLSSKHARQMNAVVYKLWFSSFHYLWRPFPSSSECSRIPMYQLSMIGTFKFPNTIFQFTVGIKGISNRQGHFRLKTKKITFAQHNKTVIPHNKTVAREKQEVPDEQ